MATFVNSMNLSLDGYVDHDRFAPDAVLFRHWIDVTRRLAGSVYGRRIYELMRYWDDDQPEWSDDERAFADAWRAQPKWVVSRSLDRVGPNATLVSDDIAPTLRRLKSDLSGEVDVAGTILSQSLGELGLIDEYRLYYHPVVLGSGTPFFAGPLPRLRLIGTDRFSGDVVRLTYAPA
jgi:dihydrofolate reductase